MFGFAKKPSAADASEGGEKKKTDAKQQVLPAAVIADDKFMVMPAQYLPNPGSVAHKRTIPKKVLLLGGGAVLVLGGLFTLLYIVFLVPKNEPAPSTPVVASTQQPSQPSQPTAPVTGVSETVVVGQAIDTSNAIIGSITVTIPATVAQQYGSGIGVTVLAQDDITLPEEGVVLGGLYSIYPAGITFEEPLLVELFVASIPESYAPADVYPAFLRGVKWEAFSDYQATDSGFTIMLEKVPSGPIAVIAAPETATSTAPGLTVAHLPPTADTDGDGLTDAEELLFGTNSASPDSDSDSYTDLAEIKNGYSPIAAGGALLGKSGLFATYTNTTYGYQVDYPASWLADSLDQTNKQVLFISSTEEFFEILIIENPLNTPIADWFRAQSPSLKNADLSVSVLDGHPAVWSPDGLTLYTGADGLIYIITYNSGTREDISWPNVFEHFYSSFKFGATTTQSTPPNGSADAPPDPGTGGA